MLEVKNVNLIREATIYKQMYFLIMQVIRIGC